MRLNVEIWIAVATFVVGLAPWAVGVYATLYTEKAREQWERLPNAWKRVPWKRVGLAGWLVSAVSAGFLGYLWSRPAVAIQPVVTNPPAVATPSAMATPPVVAIMVGSSNVKAHLKLPAGIRPIWIDVPSRDGQAALFHAAEYGAKTGASPEALLGLSSYGIEELSILWDQGTPEERAKNYWLSIRVGTPPLALLYSPHDLNDGSFPKVFKVAGFMRINCSDLNTFFKKVTRDNGLQVYMPEPRTGTRLALEKECGFDTKDWPSDQYGDWLHYPPQSITRLDGRFVDLVSVPMVTNEAAGIREQIPDCPGLHLRHTEVATVCKSTKKQGGDCGSLENLARADHIVIVKVKHEGGVYRIANPMECEIAKSLITEQGKRANTDAHKPWLDDSCTVHGEPFPEPPPTKHADRKRPPHVFEIEGRSENLPEYWTCSPSEQ